MINQELLDILRCPHCAPRGEGGALEMVQESWLVCKVCERKYPIRDDIPVMLVEVGEKWMATDVDGLPVPPPEDA